MIFLFFFRYLVSEEIKLFTFFQSIRKKLQIDEIESIFFFIGGTKLDKLGMIYFFLCIIIKYPIEMGLKFVYEKHKDEDGFLYIEYSNYPTFGC